MFRRLDSARIVDTAAKLHRRIDERFAGSGLAGVAAEVEAVAREAAALSAWLAAPMRGVRVLAGLACACLVLVAFGGAYQLYTQPAVSGWSDALQGIEALVNNAVFLGIAIYFLLSIETRRKRARALAALHVLRSLAHIIDMHQLTKDPERGGSELNTASSPERSLTPFEMSRYLDYCTELLAIISKVAALYVQELSDPVTVDAASAVEDLSVSLSRTIWQKIVILDRVLVP
jgi:hypothetical protein